MMFNTIDNSIPCNNLDSLAIAITWKKFEKSILFISKNMWRFHTIYKTYFSIQK